MLLIMSSLTNLCFLVLQHNEPFYCCLVAWLGWGRQRLQNLSPHAWRTGTCCYPQRGWKRECTKSHFGVALGETRPQRNAPLEFPCCTWGPQRGRADTTACSSCRKCCRTMRGAWGSAGLTWLSVGIARPFKGDCCRIAVNTQIAVI